MLLWTLTFITLFWGFCELKPLALKLQFFLAQGRAILELRKSAEHLKLLSQILESGLVPDDSDWKKVSTFPKPWGPLMDQSIRELRDQGAPVLPSLARMQATLFNQIEQIQEAKVKSAQALGQAMMAFVLLPIAGLALYALVPGLERETRAFFALMGFALFLNALSFVWMISLCERARFVHLSTAQRSWLLLVDATIDRIIALVSTGQPPDLAWKRAIEELAFSEPKLAQAWGALVWDTEFQKPDFNRVEAERLMISTGIEVKRTIQTSLVEGRPCLDRIEAVQKAFQLDLKMLVSKELNLLPNRCLTPLFVLVLPSFFVLLGGSLFLAMGDLLT